MTFAIPAAIFAEAFLSFIGIGIKSPQTSWGLLVSMGMKQIHTYPLRLFFPSSVNLPHHAFLTVDRRWVARCA